LAKTPWQTTNYATLFEYGETLYLRYSNNFLEFGFYDGTEWHYEFFNNIQTDDLWHHFVLRYTGSDNASSILSLTFDEQTISTLTSSQQWTAMFPLAIWGSGTNNGELNPTVKGMEGVLDDLYIFESYISDNAIHTLHTGEVLSTSETEKIHLNVFPNPTTEWVSLDIPTNLIGASVSVVNINGQVVLHELAKAQKMNMNVASLATGNYTVVVSDGNTSHSSTLIKQ